MNIFTRSARLGLIVLLCFGLQVSERISAKKVDATGHEDRPASRGQAIVAGTEELLTDSGTPTAAVGGDNLICVNRLTPTSYPATLQTIRIFFLSLSSLPSPVGAQIKLIVFTGAQGTSQPSNNPTLLINQTVTIPTFPASGTFIDFPIQNGPTINSGDFYIGFQSPTPRGGVVFAADSLAQPKQRAFFSQDNGQTYQGPLVLSSGPTNLMIRAVVSNTTAAAPSIDAPSTLSFDYVNLGVTGEKALTVRNKGDAPLNITSLTANSPQFTIAPVTLPLTIAPGAQSSITLRFAPSGLGAQNATLAIASNDPARPSINISLSGVGGPAPTALTAFATSGAAQTGSMPAPPAGSGVLHLTQYAVFVPAGAALLKVDLTGNQDLDLFVRFNQPITVTSGGLQADFRSVNSGAVPESVLITPLTTPPLQSGLYYISIANFGPGSANFSLTATITGATAPGAMTTVSAANFAGPEVASEQIVAGFGPALANSTQIANTNPLPTELAGASIRVRDNAGGDRLAPLFFVSPQQANFQIPAGTATGAAFLTFTNGSITTSTSVVQVVKVAPGIFSANSDGQGVAAASVLRAKANGAQSYEPVARFDAGLSRFVTAPIDLGPDTDQLFLILYGTGFRGRTSLSTVTATIGGTSAMVAFADVAPGFIGLDQVNLLIPRSLAGHGEVDVVLTVDGKVANTVKINIK
jgi:uncharacterized protein (TIGR03437 family)